MVPNHFYLFTSDNAWVKGYIDAGREAILMLVKDFGEKLVQSHARY